MNEVICARYFRDHEQLGRVLEPEGDLHAIVTSHNTRRRSALGGRRFWKYAEEDAAFTDAICLLSRMT